MLLSETSIEAVGVAETNKCTWSPLTRLICSIYTIIAGEHAAWIDPFLWLAVGENLHGLTFLKSKYALHDRQKSGSYWALYWITKSDRPIVRYGIEVGRYFYQIAWQLGFFNSRHLALITHRVVWNNCPSYPKASKNNPKDPQNTFNIFRREDRLLLLHI